MIHFCYALFDERGEPFYIGIGSKSSRPTDHVRYAKRGRKGRRYSKIRRMLRNRFDMPIVIIRDGMTNAQAKAMEIALIAALGRYPNGPLTNLSPGGNAPHENNPLKGRTLPPEIRAKISAKLTGRKLGPYSPERIARTRVGLIGRKCKPHTAEWKAKVGEASRRSWLDPVVRAARISKTGRKHRPETIAKMKATAAARGLSEQMRILGVALGKARAGTAWINNGTKERTVSSDQAVPPGWEPGRLKRMRTPCEQ